MSWSIQHGELKLRYGRFQPLSLQKILGTGYHNNENVVLLWLAEILEAALGLLSVQP